MYLPKISTAIMATRKNGWRLFSSECFRLLLCAIEHGPYLRYLARSTSHDRPAIDFRSKVEHILTSPLIAARCPALSIAVEIVENSEFNAFALKLSPTRESYLIGLFSGTLHRLLEVTSSTSFIGLVRKSIPQFGPINDEELALTAFYFCSSFIAFHEVGHVVRGHLNLRLSTGGKAVWLETDDYDHGTDTAALTSHVTECDADNFAGRLLLGTAVECADLARNTGRIISYPKVRQGFRELACACAGLIFLLFDTEPHTAGDFYPIAPIRLAIALGMFSDQLVVEGEKQKDAINTALRGLLLSQAVAKINNWPQQDIDLATEFSNWQQRFMPEVKAAAKVLHEYTPCQNR